MKTKILVILFLTTLFVYGCSTPKGDDVCSKACNEQYFIEGNCEALGVAPTPCETKFNKTTVYSEEGLCPEYGKDKISWWRWNVNKERISGISNVCCCH
jgi:hypothetical protein